MVGRDLPEFLQLAKKKYPIMTVQTRLLTITGDLRKLEDETRSFTKLIFDFWDRVVDLPVDGEYHFTYVSPELINIRGKDEDGRSFVIMLQPEKYAIA